MTTLTTLALVGTAVAAVASAGAALVGGMQQAKVARYNATLNEQNAQIARQQAAADEEAFRRRAQRISGAQRAAIGASGITLEGSALDLTTDTEVELEREALGIRYQGDMAARRYESEAAGYRYRARSAEMGGYIGAGTSVLSGVGKIGTGLLSGSSSSLSNNWFERGLRG